ncbi:MAG: Fpg/Nei family DNA glycosylase [Planctomycetales bacterium]|nr:Fpg/Nei family DNA glycosylase [Planctomycetales bacterium]MCA9171159.1 Fpg/Nei family DNA glycosylase [Planctomycetales bacterium]
MPELPEVETMRRGIADVVGGTIVETRFPVISCKPIAVSPARPTLARQLRGATIERLDRIGKRLVIRLCHARALVIEPRMTGLLLLANPPDEGHLRVGWRLEGVPVDWLWFWDRRGLGTLQLLSDKQLVARYGPGKVGPDALAVTVDILRAQLAASRREIKVALLDQRAIAGIGNLYASEILHVAKVSPFTPCHQITIPQWRRIADATRSVLEEAVKYEGSTLSDGTYRNALNQNGGYQNHHRVYDRAGQDCPRGCRSQVQRGVQAQRSTFWCPRCQVLRKTNRA